MSSEVEPTTAPPVASTESAAPATNGASDLTQATSEANIAAADPNPPNAIPDPEKNDANIDEKAAGLAEGENSGATVIAPDATATTDAAATPASSKKGKDSKRRSSGIPEHKSKKKGGKKEVVLNLDCQPGDYYFARMKGHPAWPAIIADEGMLPEAIMAKRPVTARSADGTYRADVADGGKNVKDRTYPVMFLSTNEFAWMPNVDLTKLNPEDVADPESKKLPKKGLLAAYQTAAERHPLEHYKKMMSDFEEARKEHEKLLVEKEEKAAEKQAKKQEREEKAATKETKGKRKSTATIADDEDVEMEDVEEAPKSSKKRKKSGVESEGEDKPAKKTPKIKLNATKPTNGDSAKSKKTKTPNKAKDTPEAEKLSEHERLERKEKNVLYLRHKLQKGFLQTTAPQESEMADMASHMKTLEQYKELEVKIIRNTKIHKVLKAILKLDTVPKDEEYNFKKRSSELLNGWNDALAKEDGVAADSPAAAATNGEKEEAKPEAKVEASAPAKEATKTEDEKEKDTDTTMADAAVEPPEAPVETTTPGNDAKDEAADGAKTGDADVSMDDAVLVEKSEIPPAVESATATETIGETNADATAAAVESA